MSPEKKVRIKNRDGNKCVLCNSREQLTIDHIIPISEGGTNEAENLRTLCKGCNVMKANKPPRHKAWFNLLFSRKSIYEFKNEIRGEMAAKDGLLLVEMKRLLQEQKDQIDILIKALQEQQTKQSENTKFLAERLKALQDYHHLEWFEETLKGYKKVKPTNR